MAGATRKVLPLLNPTLPHRYRIAVAVFFVASLSRRGRRAREHHFVTVAIVAVVVMGRCSVVVVFAVALSSPLSPRH